MKEYIGYFIAAYFWGMFLQILVDLFRGIGIRDILTKSNIWGICFAGFLFAILMTLLKFLEERRRSKK